MKLFGPKISKEEHNRVKQALEQTNKQLTEKIKVLEGSNTQLVQDKENLVKEIESLRAQHRKDVITALHQGCYFQTDQLRNNSIEAFTKSKMPIEEINKIHLEQLRCIELLQKGAKQKFPFIK